MGTYIRRPANTKEIQVNVYTNDKLVYVDCLVRDDIVSVNGLEVLAIQRTTSTRKYTVVKGFIVKREIRGDKEVFYFDDAIRPERWPEINAEVRKANFEGEIYYY